MQRSILLVDDELNILKALQRQLMLLEKADYRIYTAQNALEGLELLKSNPIQVILSDHRMPEMNGTEFLSQVKELYPQTIRMVLSGYSDFTAVQDAINKGNVYRFLNKPWRAEELIRHIEDAYIQYDAQKKYFFADQAMARSIEGVMITDNKFNTLSVNTTFCLNTEYPEQEVIGSYIDLFDRAQVTAEELDEIYVCLENQGVWQGDIWFKKKSGTPFPVFLSISAIYDEAGNLMNYLYSFI